MSTRPVDPRATKAVPIQFAGKWIVWASDHSQILAHSDSIQELWRIARDKRISDPIFEKVPRSDARFVGMRLNSRIGSTSARFPERPISV